MRKFIVEYQAGYNGLDIYEPGSKFPELRIPNFLTGWVGEELQREHALFEKAKDEILQWSADNWRNWNDCEEEMEDYILDVLHSTFLNDEIKVEFSVDHVSS